MSSTSVKINIQTILFYDDCCRIVLTFKRQLLPPFSTFDRGSRLLRNVAMFVLDWMASHP